MKTKDLTQENIAKLTKLFPELLTEVEKDGEKIKTINVEKLKKIVGDFADAEDEVYELTWAGKNKSRQKIVIPIDKTLRPVPEESVDFENTENLFIEGDNFEVLKILQEAYLNKIKMIYIDPPYNTGKDFVYNDKFRKDSEQYSLESGATDEEGNKLKDSREINTKTNPLYHSDWLSMMYERLILAKDLLKDDGIVFISIDDNEVDNLKKLCDEIFGESNFIAILPTIMNLKGNNDQFGFAGTHEYTLVYTKNKDVAEFGCFALEEETIEEEWEKDEIGYFKKGANLKSTGANAPRQKRPNLFYPIYVNPKTEEVSVENKGKEFVKILPITNGEEMSWRWSKNKVESQEQDIIINNSNGEISLYKKQRPQLGDLPTKKPKSIFYKPEYSSGNGTNELNKILNISFGNDMRPKPVELIRDFIHIASKEEDIILDFFSGTSTTAQAVLEENLEFLTKRKFIMVQLPEETEKGSEPFKAGYKNIAEIGKERIRRVSKKIEKQLKETKKQQTLNNSEQNNSWDIGFRVFKVDSTNMKNVYYNPTAVDQRTLGNFKSNIKDDRTDKDLLYQVLLELAIPISAKVTEEKINNKSVYKVNGNFMVACFDDKLDLETVKKLAEIEPLRIVFKDSSFKDDATKVNCDEYLKNKLPNTIIKVI